MPTLSNSVGFRIIRQILSSSWFKSAFAISVVFLLFHFNRLDWRGLGALGERWRWLMFAFLFMLPTYLIVSYRFLIVLRSQQIFVSFFQAFRWTMIGSFFDLAMPSSSGGDLIKVAYVMKHTQVGKRIAVVMAVAFDRILGLLGLFLLAAIVAIAGWSVIQNLQGSRFYW